MLQTGLQRPNSYLSIPYNVHAYVMYSAQEVLAQKGCLSNISLPSFHSSSFSSSLLCLPLLWNQLSHFNCPKDESHFSEGIHSIALPATPCSTKTNAKQGVCRDFSSFISIPVLEPLPQNLIWFIKLLVLP